MQSFALPLRQSAARICIFFAALSPESRKDESLDTKPSPLSRSPASLSDISAKETGWLSPPPSAAARAITVARATSPNAKWQIQMDRRLEPCSSADLSRQADLTVCRPSLRAS